MRQHGDPDCVWVDQYFVETASAYAKDKADWDRQSADAISTLKAVSEQFDRDHPECKNYKTNSHLPKYCY